MPLPTASCRWKGWTSAVYGEIVTFENGAKGMVESVEPGRLGIMLFDGAETVGVGTLVTRSGKRAGIPVGDAFLGRVIDPLGEPIDGKGPIEADRLQPHRKAGPRYSGAPERRYPAPHRHPRHRLHVPHRPRPA